MAKSYSSQPLLRGKSSLRIAQQDFQDMDAIAKLEATTNASSEKFIETNKVTQAVDFHHVTRPLFVSEANCPAEVDKVVIVEERTPVNGVRPQGKMYFRIRVAKRGKYSLWSMLRGSEFFVSCKAKTHSAGVISSPAAADANRGSTKGTVWHVPKGDGWRWRKFWQPFNLEIGIYDLVIACREPHAGVAFIWLGDGPFYASSASTKPKAKAPTTEQPRSTGAAAAPLASAAAKKTVTATTNPKPAPSPPKTIITSSAPTDTRAAEQQTTRTDGTEAEPSPAPDARDATGSIEEVLEAADSLQPIRQPIRQSLSLPNYQSLDPDDEDHLSKQEALELRLLERKRDEWIRSVLEHKKEPLQNAKFIPLFGAEAARLKDKYNAKRRVLSYFDAKPEDRRVFKLFAAYQEHQDDIKRALKMPKPKLHESKSFFASKTYIY